MYKKMILLSRLLFLSLTIPLLLSCLHIFPSYSLDDYSALTLESVKVFGVPKPINYKLKCHNGFFWGINKTGTTLNIIQFNRSKIFLDPNSSVQIQTLENILDENVYVGDFELIKDTFWVGLTYFNNGHVRSSLLEYNTKTGEHVFYPHSNEYPLNSEIELSNLICYHKERNIIYFVNNNCGMMFLFSLENKMWLNEFVGLNNSYVTTITIKNDNIYFCGRQLSSGKGFVSILSLNSQERCFLHDTIPQFDAFIFDSEENMWCLSKSEKILSLFTSNKFVDYDLNPMVTAKDLILDSMKGNIWLADSESQKTYRFCLLNRAFAIHFETNPLTPISFVSDEKSFTWIFGVTTDRNFGFTCVEKAYDLNNDCKVDMKDVGIILRSLWKTKKDIDFVKRIDIDGDGVINLKDLAYIVKYYTTAIY